MSRILAALSALVLLLTACTNPTAGLRLTIATGFDGGVYYALGTALADEWSTQTGIEKPVVLRTNGSADNVMRLRNGQANVGIMQADVAATDQEKNGSSGHKPLALARIYDDYLHIAVRADSPIQSVRDLHGKKVAIGAPISGVEVIATRVLNVAGVTAAPDPPVMSHVSLSDSAAQLQKGQIDAFFWSGGLPTKEIRDLANAMPLRLVDMGDVMDDIRKEFPYYAAATIPVTTYNLQATRPVTTLIVPNLLMVTNDMSADAAKVLTQGVFEAKGNLAKVASAANSIDQRSAIETRPVPLHEGALEYYREIKI